MSQAEDLLNNLSETEEAANAAEPHIIVNADRTITVPDELKHIAVQFDNNIETVTFDCPRYWDKHDAYDLDVYIIFRRSDGFTDECPVENLRIDDSDDSMIHFDWTISKSVTHISGNISIQVCLKSADSGVDEPHGHSRINRELIVDESLQ